MNLISSIIAETQLINHQQATNKVIYSNSTTGFENEFLVILKPEIFINENRMQLQSILKLVFSKLEQFDLHINEVRIQNASYLKTYQVIDRHYGVINAAARDLKQFVSEEARLNFQSIYGLSFNKASAFGALELLTNQQMDASTLNKLWKDCEIKRLGSGFYCGKVKFKGEDIYIVNGFHPPQLEHFIAEKRLIVTMNVSGNTDWKIARKKLIGNTYPEKADPESIRGALYKQFGNYGFENISYVINSIHLSAGPLEGLIELQGFNSAFEIEEKADLACFSFGKKLLKKFTLNEIEFMLSNPTVKNEGQAISLFDLTEETNSADALELLEELSFY